MMRVLGTLAILGIFMVALSRNVEYYDYDLSSTTIH
jgi:hypothetical protein